MKYILTIIFATIGILTISAQDCTDYHQFHCQYADYTYYYSRQSKSALFERGQTSELRVVFYGGEDYYISICANRKWTGMRFRLLEDNEERTVLYDNQDNDYAESLTISNEITRNVIIEVTAPDPERPADVGEKRCVGVVLMFRPSEQQTDTDGKMGF